MVFVLIFTHLPSFQYLNMCFTEKEIYLTAWSSSKYKAKIRMRTITTKNIWANTMLTSLLKGLYLVMLFKVARTGSTVTYHLRQQTDWTYVKMLFLLGSLCRGILHTISQPAPMCCEISLQALQPLELPCKTLQTAPSGNVEKDNRWKLL